MSTRVPTDDEAIRRGIDLGVLKEGEPVSARKLADVKRFMVAEGDHDRAVADAQAGLADVTAVSGTCLELFNTFTEGGMTDSSAAQVVAALAPSVWRTNEIRKAAHQ
ncbi:hypothetical protein [Gordonia rubripertincta]|uniref:hypothetical protein n=1 Tax=Gordonia rubripertincta TaxID=36822 RepID=UPI0015F8F67C|nr:hypothetical protein [Gordonia rubripertincta]QMU22502.1 hypothetical protein H3V45_08560 [Gordonia rubripertincta]